MYLLIGRLLVTPESSCADVQTQFYTVFGFLQMLDLMLLFTMVAQL